MTLHKWGLALSVLTAFALCPFAASAAEAPQGPAPGPQVQEPSTVQLPPGVIAMVNGEPISEQVWLDALKRVAGAGILEVMIRHKLVEQAAKNAGVTISDDAVQELIDKAVVELGGMDNFQAGLEDSGETMEDYRARVRIESLLRKMVEPSVTVTDDDVQKLFLEQYGRKAEVQVIVSDTEPNADAVLSQLKAGGDFTALAETSSADPYTAQNHGYLPGPLTDGFFPKPYGSIVITKPIADKIFSMKAGEISGILPAMQEGGFYIFRLIRLNPPMDVKLETVREQVAETARQMKLAHEASLYLQKLMQAADVSVGIQQQ